MITETNSVSMDAIHQKDGDLRTFEKAFGLDLATAIFREFQKAQPSIDPTAIEIRKIPLSLVKGAGTRIVIKNVQDRQQFPLELQIKDSQEDRDTHEERKPGVMQSLFRWMKQPETPQSRHKITRLFGEDKREDQLPEQTAFAIHDFDQFGANKWPQVIIELESDPTSVYLCSVNQTSMVEVAQDVLFLDEQVTKRDPRQHAIPSSQPDQQQMLDQIMSKLKALPGTPPQNIIEPPVASTDTRPVTPDHVERAPKSNSVGMSLYPLEMDQVLKPAMNTMLVELVGSYNNPSVNPKNLLEKMRVAVHENPAIARAFAALFDSKILLSNDLLALTQGKSAQLGENVIGLVGYFGSEQLRILLINSPSPHIATTWMNEYKQRSRNVDLAGITMARADNLYDVQILDVSENLARYRIPSRARLLFKR